MKKHTLNIFLYAPKIFAVVSIGLNTVFCTITKKICGNFYNLEARFARANEGETFSTAKPSGTARIVFV